MQPDTTVAACWHDAARWCAARSRPPSGTCRQPPIFTSAWALAAADVALPPTPAATLQVLREHRATLMTVAETFLHDPLVDWNRTGTQQAVSRVGQGGAGAHGENLQVRRGGGGALLPLRLNPSAGLCQACCGTQSLQQPGCLPMLLLHPSVAGSAPSRCLMCRPWPCLQARDALTVMEGRLSGTIIGVRCSPSLPLSCEGQAARLLAEAADKENLARMYVWWMPWF